MSTENCILIGAPVETGASQAGCVMGPASFRTAGIAKMLQDLGCHVRDMGDLSPNRHRERPHSNPAVRNLAETIGWTESLHNAATTAADAGFPIFLGGDHSLSLGSVAGMAQHAAGQNRPLFVLWLDAHPDFHTPDSTASGNLHGTPLAYVTGQTGFEDFPPLDALVAPENLCLFGIRSVDPAELTALRAQNICVHDMRSIDENGVVKPISDFLARVEAANGMLHVSLDVDFLEPDIAPAVGTTVPGGATFREAHLVMELLHDSGLVTSLDLVELNPFLDERGRTARLMVDLTSSLMGRQVLDRPTRRF